MRKFESSPKKPLVFYFDMKENKMMSFQMFLYSFEKMLVDTLCQRNKEQISNGGQELISIE